MRPDNFKLQLFYQSPSSLGELAYLTTKEGVQRQLLSLTGLDELTNNSTSQSDNRFDFLEGTAPTPEPEIH